MNSAREHYSHKKSQKVTAGKKNKNKKYETHSKNLKLINYIKKKKRLNHIYSIKITIQQRLPHVLSY